MSATSSSSLSHELIGSRPRTQRRELGRIWGRPLFEAAAAAIRRGAVAKAVAGAFAAAGARDRDGGGKGGGRSALQLL